VLLVDRKQRVYLLWLQPGGVYDLRGGRVRHDDLLGQPDGAVVHSSRGERLLALRPTLADYILAMPRGAQVIYPKDLGPILLLADVYPGLRVAEAGTGSGALAMTLARAVGPAGRVFSYDIREEFLRTAERNVRRFLGAVPQLTLRLHDITTGIPDGPVDRVLLDLPEPWRVVAAAREALVPGGIFLAYVPSTVQVQQTVEALRAGGFARVEAQETLVRPWHVDGAAVRPVHRMVGHTGFLVVARRPGAAAPPAAPSGVPGAGPTSA
jgi:tRNA (adenine57-N1/adenine58-N1)-methyltransferase